MAGARTEVQYEYEPAKGFTRAISDDWRSTTTINRSKSINDPLLPTSEKKPVPAKDTSVRAWVTVFFAMCAYSCSLAILYSFGVYVVPLEDEFQSSRGGVSWIGSIVHFFSYFAGIFAGASVERFGPRFTVVLSGTMLIGSGVATPYATAVWQMYLSFGVLVGSACSFAVIPSMSVVVTWFDKHRGIATGLTAAGAGVGNLVAPVVAQYIMDIGPHGHRGGLDWRSAIMYLNVGCGSAIILSSFFLEFRPADIDGSSVNRTNEPSKKKTERDMVGDAMRNRYFQYFLAFVVVGSISFNVPMVHISPYAEAYDVSDDNAALLLSMMGAAQIVGRIGHGMLADSIGAVESLTGAILLMGVSATLWPILCKSFGSMLAFVVVYGVNVGAVYALPAVIIGNYFTRMKPSTLLGIYFTFGSPLMLLGPVIAGYIYDTTGSYFGSAFTIGIPLLLSAVFLVLMLREQKRETRSQLRSHSDDVNSKSHRSSFDEVSVQGDSTSERGNIVVSYKAPAGVTSAQTTT